MIKNEIFQKRESTSSVSVIIPTFREERYIKKCLDSLKQQSMAPLEIIIVDSRSGDRTVEFTSVYTDKIVGVDRGSIGRSRNIGAKNSCGDVLMFVDADIILNKDFIRNTVIFFENNKNIGAASAIFKPLEEESSIIHNFITHFLINNVAKFSLLIKKPHITGGAFAIRKDIFWKLGGFNENLETAEDTEIFRKISKFSRISVNNMLVAEMSMRRFKDLDWLYDWVLGSFYYELTGKSLVANYKVKR